MFEPSIVEDFNLLNKIRSDNITGHIGIIFDKQKQKWRITYFNENKRYHGGFYNTKEEAIANYYNPFKLDG